MDEAAKKVSRSKSNTRQKNKRENCEIIGPDISLDSMNKKELRYYISKLQNELKQLRIDCNQSSDVKNKLESFVTQEQEIYLDKKHCLTANDFKVNDTIHEFEDRLKAFRHETDYINLKKHEQQALEAFTGFFNETSDKLLKNKLERNQAAGQISVVENLLSEIITMDMIAGDLFGNYKNWSKEISFEHVLKCRDAMQKFSAIKLRILNSIWDFDFSGEEPISIEIEKMQFYFNQLHEDNVKALQKWREKVIFLQDQFEKVYSDLNEALNLNEELKKQNVLNTESSKSNMKGINNERYTHVCELINSEFDNAVIVNLKLKNKLKNIEEERLVLKNRFLSNVRRIHRTAEFKSFVAETLLQLGLAINESETCNTKHSHRSSHLEMGINRKIKQDSDDSYRLLKMSCVGPNTLFVPPVF